MRKVRTAPGQIPVETAIPFAPNMRKPESPKGLVLCLHGYDQTGSYMSVKLDKFISEDWAIVSPNAPFPIPHWDATFPAPGWRNQTLKLGYTWYFYQSKDKEYYIDMNTSLDFLANGVDKLGFGELPKIVVGFSQGGYVAPFAGTRLKKVRQVVCISSEFIAEELPENVGFRIDGVFGDNDPIASLEAARKTHQEVLAKGVRGEFHVVSGVAHEVTSSVGEKLRSILTF